MIKDLFINVILMHLYQFFADFLLDTAFLKFVSWIHLMDICLLIAFEYISENAEATSTWKDK